MQVPKHSSSINFYANTTNVKYTSPIFKYCPISKQICQTNKSEGKWTNLVIWCVIYIDFNNNDDIVCTLFANCIIIAKDSYLGLEYGH
jgi:hypothetical protein